MSMRAEWSPGPRPDGPRAAQCPIWPDLLRLVRSLELWPDAVERTPELDVDWDEMPPWTGLSHTETNRDGESTPETD